MNKLIQTLMVRDGLTREDAQDVMDEAAELVRDGADPEDVLAECFGLEPDYFYDLYEAVVNGA